MNQTAQQLRSPRHRAGAALRQWIEAGEFPAGSVLPSERKLAQRLQVSRTTIHTVLADLEAEGLVQPAAGRLRRVAENDTQQARYALSATVGVLGQKHSFLINPDHHSAGYSYYVTIGVFDSLDERRLHALTLQVDRLLTDGIGAFVNGAIRGVIAPHLHTPGPDHLDLANRFHSAGVPISVYGDGLPVEHLDRVLSDHAHGAYLATRWLLEHGCRRILRYAPGPAVKDRPGWLAARDAGYLQAMAEFGVDPIDALPMSPPSSEPESAAEFDQFVHLTAGYLLEPLRRDGGIDAIMAISDGYVAPLAGALRCHGLEPNRDVLLAGYDNYWEDSPLRQWEPTRPVITIDKRNEQIGRTLVEIIDERIRRGGLAPPIRRVIEPTLIVTGGES